MRAQSLPKSPPSADRVSRNGRKLVFRALRTPDVTSVFLEILEQVERRIWVRTSSSSVINVHSCGRPEEKSRYAETFNDEQRNESACGYVPPGCGGKEMNHHADSWWLVKGLTMIRSLGQSSGG